MDLFFRSVEVPPGSHSIKWEYVPDLFMPLVILSYSGILILSISAMFFILRSNRLRV
jgi:uncharacterized membrane protein YfhO